MFDLPAGAQVTDLWRLGVISDAGALTPSDPRRKRPLTIAMVPKIGGIEYCNACERGAREAAAELGSVQLVFDGPDEPSSDAQTTLIEGYIARKVGVIAVSPVEPEGLAPVLRKARDSGIRVVTWEADAAEVARDIFINPSPPRAMAKALVDEMVAQVGTQAQVAIVTSSPTDESQNAWIAAMQDRLKLEYPSLKLVGDPRPCENDQQLAAQVTHDLLQTYPRLKGVWGMSTVASAGAAEAVAEAHRGGKVAVVGLGTPNVMRQWVAADTVKTVILWNPIDLGYLTVYAAAALCDGELGAGTTGLEAGRLGRVEVEGDRVLLGAPTLFPRGNIDRFDF